ncbi:carrier protein, putative [Cryptosporidium muris RN66]|uniref:Carrier protein, putative n=1 Tax=Cryptosporidium muris (strain RN66) TaxID=441375 RepID=B6ACJ5_CRYMR|nr:carrier protein, putative [Cryptosporidium muris RN66]EEA05849.1 carrier protein, putative [Cryptosporidium muris RN66]|eukprot:XP_002140198.1 carrier protein [Cryptosporidium muris RN66]
MHLNIQNNLYKIQETFKDLYNENNISREYIEGFAGGFSGITTKFIIYPLDRVKILKQIIKYPLETNKNRKSWDIFRIVFQSEGVSGLWKGGSFSLARAFISSGIGFYTFKLMDDKLQSVQFISNNQNSIKKFIAGSISGLSILLTTYPLDVLNTRRAILGICGVPLTHKPALKNLSSGFIWTLFGSIPYGGISFLVFHSLKSYWQKYSELDSLRLWLSGGVAGVIALSITYPIDTLRKLKQVESILNSEVGNYNFLL